MTSFATLLMGVSMRDIDDLLIDLREKSIDNLGFDLTECEQGSEEWHTARLGVITASRAEDIYKKLKNGKHANGRETYMLQLVAEILTGEAKSVSGASLNWGTENEHAARLEHGDSQELPFIYTDDMRCGYSPDGLTDTGLVEIKCPYTTEVHLKTVFDGFIKPEYHAQMQFGMWVSGRNYCDFVSYDPRIIRTTNICTIRVEKDNEIQDLLSEEVPKFISEMDEYLDKLGVKFGDQWNII